MSYREVNTLRKNGELDKAIAMAEEDLERGEDKWSCSAMLWCLNDKIKSLSGEELAAAVARMKALAERIGPDDDIVARAIQRAERLLIPHVDEVRKAGEDSKEKGKAMAAYTLMANYYDSGELDSSFYTDFGWIIYRALHEDNSDDVVRRKKMLNKYLQLKLESPSLLHSLILTEAVKIEKATPLQFLFSGFLNLWNLENLRDEDWKRGESGEGRSLPSLVEKMITVYVREMDITPTVSPSQEFLSVLDQALDKFPDNEHLPRYKALLLIKEGNGQEAVTFYKQLLKKSPMKIYLWSELAELIEDSNLKTGLLCKALSFNQPEEYLGKIRLALANQFCINKMYGNALAEINQVKSVYEKMGWHLSSELQQVAGIIPQGTEPANNKVVYDEYSLVADAYIYSDVPLETVIKIGERQIEGGTQNGGSHDKKSRPMIKWILLAKDNSTFSIKPKKFALPRKSPDGTCLEVRRSGNQIITATVLSELPDCNWMKAVQGELQLKVSAKTGKSFGFVGDYYVHEKLLKGLENGCMVKGVAVKRDDKWQLIRVERTE